MKRKGIEDYFIVGMSRNIIFDDIVIPKTSKIRTWWLCGVCGLRWRAVYNSIQQGKGCPKCGNSAPKVEEDYYKLASKKNFIYLGPFPKNTHMHTSWECKICKKVYNNISYHDIKRNSKCPKCSNRTLLLEQDYIDLSHKNNIIFIGPTPLGNKELTKWKCRVCDCLWSANYNNIQQGTQCPRCSNRINGTTSSKIQEKLYYILYDTLPVEGCKNYNIKVGTRYVDIMYNYDEVNVAIEYDGWYWHSRKDIKRDTFLVSLGYKVLHVLSKSELPTKKEINNIINTKLDLITTYYWYLSDWRK